MLAKFHFSLGVMICMALLSGCAPKYVWRTATLATTFENRYFSAQIYSGPGMYGREYFILRVVNYSDKQIEVNWSKTLYIMGAQTWGRFMFAGDTYESRMNPKPPDIIAPRAIYEKKIFPNSLVFSGGLFGKTLKHETMPPGENGVDLTITVDGMEYRGKMIEGLGRS